MAVNQAVITPQNVFIYSVRLCSAPQTLISMNRQCVWLSHEVSYSLLCMLCSWWYSSTLLDNLFVWPLFDVWLAQGIMLITAGWLDVFSDYSMLWVVWQDWILLLFIFCIFTIRLVSTGCGCGKECWKWWLILTSTCIMFVEDDCKRKSVN